ncbi:unnamed protein product, partial [Ectocarpus sp. 8 AP-2014]
ALSKNTTNPSLSQMRVLFFYCGRLFFLACTYMYVLSTLPTSASVGPTAPWSLLAATQDVAYTTLAGDSFTVAAASLCAEKPPKSQIGGESSAGILQPRETGALPR